MGAAKSFEMVRWWHASFGEEERFEVVKSIRNGNISQGPVVKEFEDRLDQISVYM